MHGDSQARYIEPFVPSAEHAICNDLSPEDNGIIGIPAAIVNPKRSFFLCERMWVKPFIDALINNSGKESRQRFLQLWSKLPYFERVHTIYLRTVRIASTTRFRSDSAKPVNVGRFSPRSATSSVTGRLSFLARDWSRNGGSRCSGIKN